MPMFPTGTKVRIRKDSKFYRQAPGIIGVVHNGQVDDLHKWVSVRFENGYRNSYRINGGPIDQPGDDLEVVVPAVKVTLTRKRRI